MKLYQLLQVKKGVGGAKHNVWINPRPSPRLNKVDRIFMSIFVGALLGLVVASWVKSAPHQAPTHGVTVRHVK